MSIREKLIVLVLFIFVCAIPEIAKAKSVYVINDTEKSELQAYKIDGTNLTHQVDYVCELGDTGASGAVGVALDESEYGAFLFVTFEDRNEIELVDAKGMVHANRFEVPDPYGNLNLSGIVLDKSRRKVYVIDRGRSHLYVYSWNVEKRKLTLDYDEPYYVELQDCYEGYGLSLDEENGRLYVGDNTTTVKYYDVNDVNWGKIDEFTVTDKAVGIAIDVENQYVYTGGSQFGGSTFLNKYDLSTRTETCVDVGSPVLGITVDQGSSLVYITTYGFGSNWDKLMVYDSDLTLQSSTGDIGNPAGVVVGNVSYKPPNIYVSKDDGIGAEECVSPDDEITYTITYGPKGENHENVVITEWLPDEVDYPNILTDPNYDPQLHTYTWQIGSLAANDPCNSVTLKVQVNETAEPLGRMSNRVEIESDSAYFWDTDEVDICCWGGDVIYVDCSAGGDPNTGTSWQLAYDNLQQALDRVTKSCGCEIWVAAGEYKPERKTVESSSTFGLLDGLRVYGGFSDNKTVRDDRNYAFNKTYLSGDLDSDGDRDCDKVITAGETVTGTTILDGFIITDAIETAVYCYHARPTIRNCVITGSGGDGIYCDASSTAINNCVIVNNKGDGIEATEHSSPEVTNCIIYANDCHGINYQSIYKSFIKNSWIYSNKTDGIYLGVASRPVIIQNNTIVSNLRKGINNPGGTEPQITNCILWENDDDLNSCSATYSCISDCGDVGNPIVTHNICSDPLFAYTDPNDFHLQPDSPCVDAGNTGVVEPNELDIDGGDRVLNGDDYSHDNDKVDMGADEVSCDDIYNDLDWNEDRIIDLDDLIILADAWLSDDTPTSNWNPDCDIQPESGDGDVDYGDFAVFAAEWLWQPCWVSSGSGMWMMMGAGGDMGKMMGGGELMLINPTAPIEAAAQSQAELSVAEQIEQIKYFLDWLSEIKDEIDEDTWLNLAGSLEERLKELAKD